MKGKPEGKGKNAAGPVRIVGRKGAWGARTRGSPCFGEEVRGAVLVKEPQLAGVARSSAKCWGWTLLINGTRRTSCGG